jgi:hypothetical protein
MIAGAYEAVALEQPLILTNWLPLKRYFNKGILYIDNSSDDIRKAVMVARTNKEELSKEMHQLKTERTKESNKKISNFYYLFN